MRAFPPPSAATAPAATAPSPIAGVAASSPNAGVTATIIVVILLLLVATAGVSVWYFFFRKKKDERKPSQLPASAPDGQLPHQPQPVTEQTSDTAVPAAEARIPVSFDRSHKISHDFVTKIHAADQPRGLACCCGRLPPSICKM